MAAITNPTQLTPPRVDFLDPRTGAISREWYRFLLSLLNATQGLQDDTAPSPNVNALLASYDAMLADLSQTTESAPDSESALASLDAGLANFVQAFALSPQPALGTMAALQQANIPWLTFDNAPEYTSTSTGTVAWDGGTTLGIQMTTNVIGRVNEDLYYYIKASAAITKGQVIMFDGSVGASGVVKGKPATGVTNGSYIMGVAAESIALNGFGLVQYNGTLKGLNTSAFLDGDILWYDPAVTGGSTKTEPTAPNVKVQVAAVINAGSGGSGSILIRVSAGSVLGGTDSNVQFGTLANGDIIQYDSALGYWKNVPAGTGSGTVTSVAMSVPTGLSVSGSPITTSGTLAVTFQAGYSIPTTSSQSNWDAAYTDRLKWDGGSSGLTASTGRTSLGATTVGSNLFTLTDPSAITFPRFNADNSVSALSDSSFRTAIGLGTIAVENAGVSGTFISADTPPKTVTVTNGIITSIV